MQNNNPEIGNAENRFPPEPPLFKGGQSAEMLDQIIEHSPMALWISDAGGTMIRMNQACRECLRIQDEEVVGKYNLLKDNLIEERGFMPMVQDVFEKGATARFVVSYDTAELKNLPLKHTAARLLQVAISPIRDQHGKVIHAIVQHSDISEAVRMHEERLQYERQTRQIQKSESLTRMAGAVAHHFNNQLQAVMMSLELAEVNLASGVDCRDLLAEAIRSANKATDVSKMMLTYLGQSRPSLDNLDLSVACEVTLSLIRAAIPQNIELKKDIPQPGPVIHANENQIRQMLTNLLTNAWEAGGDKPAVVRVAVKTVSSLQIPREKLVPMDYRISEGDYACLEIADNGCGMSDQDIEKAFDPFFSTKFTGRGLGLPVVLGIVRSYRGAIAVESRPGHGSLFRVFLPLCSDTAISQQNAVPANASPSIAGDGVILVVDDEPVVRQMLSVALKRRGYRVVTASDGIEAMEVFRKHQDQMQCVLCDLTMPRMNGWETIEALRKIKRGIPMILSSGYNKEHVIAGRMGSMPEALVSKPYKIREIGDLIARVIAGKG